MIEPMTSPGESGYVPLCAALHWIATNRGLSRVMLADKAAWEIACDSFFPLIHGGEVQLQGLQAGHSLPDKIPGSRLALITVLRPLDRPLKSILSDAPSYIACTAYLGREQWSDGLNDQLYLKNVPGPAWTHLQVSKSQILQYWPKPNSRRLPEHDCFNWLFAQMKESPNRRTLSKDFALTTAIEKFPGLKDRQFDRAWRDAITHSGAKGWKVPGPLAKRSDHRTK
jgi:hypothetical protein